MGCEEKHIPQARPWMFIQSFSRGLPCLGPSWASKRLCLPVPEVHIPEKLPQNAPALSCSPGEGGRQLVTALPVLSPHRDGMFWQWLWLYTRGVAHFLLSRGLVSFFHAPRWHRNVKVTCSMLHFVLGGTGGFCPVWFFGTFQQPLELF